MPGEIPVVQVDRGGQVTYHGPGQIVGYPMVDIKRKGIGVRDFVTCMEDCMVDVLGKRGLEGYARPDAPGVYVRAPAGGHRKIGSLGIRVRRGCTYHGLALNVDMDLSPFMRINPCGYQGLEMTQMKDLMPAGIEIEQLQEEMTTFMVTALGYAGSRVTANPLEILGRLHDLT